MPDQAQDLRNYVAKHGKADAAIVSIIQRANEPFGIVEDVPKPLYKHEYLSEEHNTYDPVRSKLEWNARTLGFDMYEVSHMSTDTLQRIANLAEERFK